MLWPPPSRSATRKRSASPWWRTEPGDDLAGHVVAGARRGAEQLRGLLGLGRGGERRVDQGRGEQHRDAEGDDQPDLPLALGIHERGDYRKRRCCKADWQSAARIDMWPTPVLLITGAISGIGAATARAAAGRLPAGAGGAARGAAAGAGRRAGRRGAGDRGALRRHRVGPGRGDGRGGDRALRPDRRGLRQRRLRRQARIPRGVGRALALDGPDQRLRGRADDPRHPPPPARARQRPLRRSPARWPGGGRCRARSTRRPSGRRRRSARRCEPSCARCTRTTPSASP